MLKRPKWGEIANNFAPTSLLFKCCTGVNAIVNLNIITSTKENLVDTDQQILVDHGQTISLDFFGPFKFIKGEFYLFESAFVKSEGIYIWTIKDEKNNQNFVHYVGETVSFGKRQKEHLIQITGLNYRIIDADLAKQGIEKIIWNGMWRDRTPNAVATLLDNYTEVSKKVVDYIGLINVYFAATTLEKHLRKHIEGCLGWNFRNNYPDHKTMYPDDNYVGIKAQRLGKNLLVNLPEEIVGIDREQII